MATRGAGKGSKNLSAAGRALGRAGGPARANVLAPKRRSEIARMGGKARQTKGKKG